MKSFTLSPTLARSASAMAVAACLLMPAAAFAQSGAGIDPNAPATNAQPGSDQATAQQDGAPGATDDIVVTGIRASLNRAIDIKRNSAGVVDAISAEDIGKFPDTNLAESLQRITGVSINRVNGEGSQVSVRGFSGGFNLVTLNGRQLPSSNVDTSGGNAFARGTSRSFDFQNLASEGVSALEVYKTGRAAIPSGGIGASINIVTRKPLDSRETGLTGSIGAKALYDTTVDNAEAKKHRVTPEVSGLLNFTNADETFGASVYGSYQLRHSTSAQSGVNYWNVVPTADYLNTAGSYTRPFTVNTPTPTAPFVLIPNDSRYQFSENRRERINAQGILQFRPVETLTISVDGLFAQNKLREKRSEQTNWLNRPFTNVTFDDNDQMQTALILSETLGASTKDQGFEQQQFATKTQLKSVGANVQWEFADNLTLTLDGHHSTSKSSPDNANGTSATLMSLGAPVVNGQTLDFTGKIAKVSQIVNDCLGKGNCNNTVDVPDLGSQVGRTITSFQSQRINEARAQIGWDFGEGSRFDFGGNYIDQRMRSTSQQTTQTLGDWGIGDAGVPNQIAGDLISTYCLICKFDKFNTGDSPSMVNAFRGNAVDLLNIFQPYYEGLGKPVGGSGNVNDTVGEKTWAVYGQLTWNGEIAEHRASAVVGVRYEQTRVRALALQAVPTAIRWASDNDFFVDVPAQAGEVPGRGKYTNLLPSLDFNIDLTDQLKARASFSRTLARPDFGNLFATTTAGAPARPTALGGIPTGSQQDPNLKPLVSDNFDVSLEWYYKPSSFVSVGFFDKRVRNFIGSSIVNTPLFDLRDPSSGVGTSRSGIARTRLATQGYGLTDVNLFTYTALLIQNNGSTTAADAAFAANYNTSAQQLNQTFVDSVLGAVDIVANSDDPLFNFAVSKPVNNREGKIHGFEFALTHFFGDSGFGFAGSYTMVDGNVNVDPYANPNIDIFALTGLGDSANATLIYDKNGISARVSYNWRDKYLAATNQGGNRNPLFVDSFGTLDANISWDINDHLAISLEGINLTSEPVRTYARSKSNLMFAQELKPRFLLGARYRF
jgi:TonB-dependent receptor